MSNTRVAAAGLIYEGHGFDARLAVEKTLFAASRKIQDAKTATLGVSYRMGPGQVFFGYQYQKNVPTIGTPGMGTFELNASSGKGFKGHSAMLGASCTHGSNTFILGGAYFSLKDEASNGKFKGGYIQAVAEHKLSKRTVVYAGAGVTDGSRGLSREREYAVQTGLVHSF